MLENPFNPTRPESDTDPAANARLVGEFLGPEAQAAYEKLDQGREGKKGDDMSDLTLTDAEKAVVKEAREKEVWDRAHYIRWARSFAEDEVWVDKTFTFNSDGTVECADLDLRNIVELNEFPSELIVHGYLNLGSLLSAAGLKFPSLLERLNLGSVGSVDGLVLPASLKELGLNSLKSADGMVFPSSLKSLYLYSLKSLDGLVLPSLLETLYLSSIQSAKGHTFPSSLKILHLHSLQSTEGLTLPSSLEWLNLNSLQSAAGLVLPASLNRLDLPESLRAQVKELQGKGEIRRDISIYYS